MFTSRKQLWKTFGAKYTTGKLNLLFHFTTLLFSSKNIYFDFFFFPDYNIFSFLLKYNL